MRSGEEGEVGRGLARPDVAAAPLEERAEASPCGVAGRVVLSGVVDDVEALQGSVAAFCSEFDPLVVETKPTSGPKIWRSDHDVSDSTGFPLSTRMAIRGASSSCVPAGVMPRPRSKKTPAAFPAASRATAVAASPGKITEPAGIAPAEALMNAASATSPSTPPRSTSEDGPELPRFP